jgi:hypothetical protein
MKTHYVIKWENNFFDEESQCADDEKEEAAIFARQEEKSLTPQSLCRHVKESALTRFLREAPSNSVYSLLGFELRDKIKSEREEAELREATARQRIRLGAYKEDRRWEISEIRKEDERQRHASSVLQSTVRRRRSRPIFLADNEQRNSSIVLQGAIRRLPGMEVRQVIQRRHGAILVVQSAVRCRQGRHAVLSRRVEKWMKALYAARNRTDFIKAWQLRVRTALEVNILHNYTFF